MNNTLRETFFTNEVQVDEVFHFLILYKINFLSISDIK